MRHDLGCPPHEFADGAGQIRGASAFRLAAMADHIASTREKLRAAAMPIRQLSVELSAATAIRG